MTTIAYTEPNLIKVSNFSEADVKRGSKSTKQGWLIDSKTKVFLETLFVIIQFYKMKREHTPEEEKKFTDIVDEGQYRIADIQNKDERWKWLSLLSDKLGHHTRIKNMYVFTLNPIEYREGKIPGKIPRYDVRKYRDKSISDINKRILEELPFYTNDYQMTIEQIPEYRRLPMKSKKMIAEFFGGNLIK